MGTPTYLGYLDVQMFQNLTGITNRNIDQLNLALESSALELRRILYIKRRESFSPARTTQQLGVYSTSYSGAYGSYYQQGSNYGKMLGYLADFNLDRVVDKYDVTCWEVQNVNGLDQWTQLNNDTDITSLDVTASQITFPVPRPTVGKTLIIDCYYTRYRLEEMLPELKAVHKLMAVNECYKMMLTSQLQAGVSSWSIGDVSVNIDTAAIGAQIEQNNVELRRKIRILKPFVFAKFFDHNDKDNADVRTPRYI